MSADKLTKAASFCSYGDKELFHIPAGMKASDAASFAELASVTARDLLTKTILHNCDDGDAIWAAQFLIDAAQAAYRAAGVGT